MSGHRLAVDAISLTRFQACQRRYLLSSAWRMHRWTPKFLFDDILRAAILKFSSRHPPEANALAVDARARFMSLAADPGLDVPGDETYSQAKEYCALLEVIIRVLAKTVLLTLRPVKSVPVSEQADWNFLAMGADDSGMLHRWITLSRWDDSAFMREMHSWAVIGDIAIARVPMQLHVIVLGQFRGEGRSRHHHSAWGRRFTHPGLTTKPHFLSPSGKPLNGWTPQFLADLPGESLEDWAKQALAEGAIKPLLHHPIINCPGDDACREIKRQITIEAQRMHSLMSSSLAWHDYPMSRGACDAGFRPCPFQPLCHSERLVQPAEIGLYMRRESLYQVKEKLYAEATALAEART